MKTRASAVHTPDQATPPNKSTRSGKIRDKTNNPPPPPAPIKNKDTFKKPKPKKAKPKSKQGRHRSKSANSPTKTDEASLARHAQEATSYLHRWENNRSEWRFEKIKQIWLLKHALSQSLINDEYFEILLNYLTLLQGQAKLQTLKDMKEHMTAYENKYLGVVQKAGIGDPTEEENSQYERARQIVQMLSEDEEIN